MKKLLVLALFSFGFTSLCAPFMALSMENRPEARELEAMRIKMKFAGDIQRRRVDLMKLWRAKPKSFKGTPLDKKVEVYERETGGFQNSGQMARKMSLQALERLDQEGIELERALQAEVVQETRAEKMQETEMRQKMPLITEIKARHKQILTLRKTSKIKLEPRLNAALNGYERSVESVIKMNANEMLKTPLKNLQYIQEEGVELLKRLEEALAKEKQSEAIKETKELQIAKKIKIVHDEIAVLKQKELKFQKGGNKVDNLELKIKLYEHQTSYFSTQQSLEESHILQSKTLDQLEAILERGEELLGLLKQRLGAEIKESREESRGAAAKTEEKLGKAKRSALAYDIIKWHKEIMKNAQSKVLPEGLRMRFEQYRGLTKDFPSRGLDARVVEEDRTQKQLTSLHSMAKNLAARLNGLPSKPKGRDASAQSEKGSKRDSLAGDIVNWHEEITRLAAEKGPIKGKLGRRLKSYRQRTGKFPETGLDVATVKQNRSEKALLNLHEFAKGLVEGLRNMPAVGASTEARPSQKRRNKKARRGSRPMQQQPQKYSMGGAMMDGYQDDYGSDYDAMDGGLDYDPSAADAGYGGMVQGDVMASRGSSYNYMSQGDDMGVMGGFAGGSLDDGGMGDASMGMDSMAPSRRMAMPQRRQLSETPLSLSGESNAQKKTRLAQDIFKMYEEIKVLKEEGLVRGEAKLEAVASYMDDILVRKGSAVSPKKIKANRNPQQLEELWTRSRQLLNQLSQGHMDTMGAEGMAPASSVDVVFLRDILHSLNRANGHLAKELQRINQGRMDKAVKKMVSSAKSYAKRTRAGDHVSYDYHAVLEQAIKASIKVENQLDAWLMEAEKSSQAMA